jgi:DnaJ-class molecular chaperone
MKDLYARLEVQPTADEQELAAALRNKPGMELAAAILLDQEKRARYDRAHATLKAIGVLRQHLKLDTGDSWFLQNCPDFALGFKPAAAPAKPEARASVEVTPGERRQTTPQAQPEQGPKPRAARSVPLVGLVVAAVLLALSALYFLVLK